MGQPEQETGPDAADLRTNSENPIDSEGIPVVGPVGDWLDLFDRVGPVDARSTRWFQAILRFTRPDGSSVFGPRGRSVARLRTIESWSNRLGDPSLAAVVARWTADRSPAPIGALPPLPSHSSVDRPLAVFRPDWTSGSDLAAIDHRRPGDETLLEVAARGRVWLGPSWTSAESGQRVTKAIPTQRSSSPYADSVEWSYKVGSRRVTRSLVLLRGRSMALIGQQDDGGTGPSEIRLELGEGAEARPVGSSRSLLLSTGRGRPTARLLPLGLPADDRPTELGSIAVEGRHVVIRHSGEGRRCWLPVLICWGKAPTTWHPLTVAERSRTLKPDAGFAVRVVWGLRDDNLVIYRSLGPPALRSFLGHQTSARFLIGSFNRTGEVRPILKVDS